MMQPTPVIPGEVSTANETRDPAQSACEALGIVRFAHSLRWVPDLRSAVPRLSGMTVERGGS